MATGVGTTKRLRLGFGGVTRRAASAFRMRAVMAQSPEEIEDRTERANPPPSETKVFNLMEALKLSLGAEKKAPAPTKTAAARAAKPKRRRATTKAEASL